jgi:hypothetical protein
MVHGISSNARKTYGVPGLFLKPHPNGMYDYLIKQGYKPGIDLFWYSYPTLNPIPVSARRLKSEIQNVIKITGVQELDLLTFSLGGIIGKYYVVSPLYQNEIRNLVMIAPPFQGSHWADWFRVSFTQSADDLVFEGDGKALSPQVLSFENPFLRKLALTPFPNSLETTIIAVKAVLTQQHSLVYESFRWLTNWTGEGDLVVPIESSRINVNHFYEITEELSLKAIHRYLPYNLRVQELAFQALR